MEKIAAVIASILVLVSCNNIDLGSTGQSAVAGAAIGAGTSYLFDQDIASGAVLGAAGGALIDTVLY